jgi:hypothetical protein
MYTTLKNTKEVYLTTILGQKTPFEIPRADDGTEVEDEDNVLLQLFKADSLWNMGRGKEAGNLLFQVKQRNDYNEKTHGAFCRGLEALTSNFNLSKALVEFSTASKESNSHGMEKVFFAERAVNIAFWMACTESKRKGMRE